MKKNQGQRSINAVSEVPLDYLRAWSTMTIVMHDLHISSSIETTKELLFFRRNYFKVRFIKIFFYIVMHDL